MIIILLLRESIAFNKNDAKELKVIAEEEIYRKA